MSKTINRTCSGYCPYEDDIIVLNATFAPYEVLGANRYYQPLSSNCPTINCPYYDKCPVLEEVARTL
ncbi:MAG TPA: hypothetical protein IAC14_03870 [Candidatus Scybalomonas excrementigallinarum]|nr:hypothetical protein [Candidatus Scybalomonas excrementigallinarum]